MGSQMGKTEGLLNIIGRQLDEEPVPILYIGPTKSLIDRQIDKRITQMLRSAASLWEKTDRSKKANKLSKTVNGVTLRLAWAGSATELSSDPAHTVMVDERDRMKPIPGEGDVMELARARTSNYRSGRIIGTSTPTEGNVDVEKDPQTGVIHWKVSNRPEDVPSPIWQLWQGGTRHEWAVPCPHCAEYFIPRLRLLWWPENSTPRQARRDARLVCPSCGSHIDESHKVAMNAAGQYLAPGQRVVDGQVVGDPPDSDTASFWVSGLMSPWKSFGDRAAAYVRALRAGDHESLRVVINTGFGELYAFRGEATPAEAVEACRGGYKFGEVPASAEYITCGVDVQKRKLVYAVRGWGYDMESWLLEAGEIHAGAGTGETDSRQVWLDLADLLTREWAGKQIRRMGIDSGFSPGDKSRRPDNLIYEFCMQHRGRAVPTKGRDRLSRPLAPSLIDITFRGKVLKQGLQLWHIDSDYFKSWLMSRLLWPPDQPGRFWVPTDVSEDYCLQLTAESRVAKPSGQAVWVKVRPDNHYLDCEAINVAMAQSLGLHRRLRSSTKKADKPPPDGGPPKPGGDDDGGGAPPAPPRPRSPPAQLPRSSWVRNWR
jgi:phage terminase large subunit GpA-like protein